MQASNNLDYESTYWIIAKEKKRLEDELKELETLKSTIFNGKEKDFVVFFNSTSSVSKLR